MNHVELRAFEAADTEAVLALNAASVDHVSELDEAALFWFVEHARVVVIDVDGVVAAFAVVVEPGTSYSSPNYAWFSGRYERFLYLDRIAVAGNWRRRGIGSIIYDDSERKAARWGRLLCEVDLEPPNAASLAFHRSRGFVEVGQLRSRHGKMLIMLAKELGQRRPGEDKEN